MPININELPHISTLDSIERNFRIFAGPGAGKTTWLCKHLEHVLKNSNRIGTTGKIACITYTNVAAEEITGRLKTDINRFDISTIHSFLYRNIVKPFSYLIENDENDEALFNILDMDGHDEHIVHRERFSSWIRKIERENNRNYQYLSWNQNKQNVIAELSSIDYAFTNGNVDITIRKPRGARIPRNNNELWFYKNRYWRDGIMHHEDVLYFSYLIINKSPRVLDFLRTKYPYIFIDEFQDTTELQTWIIKKISESETIVGVVGDLAQSIYRFTGARREDFESFKIPDLLSYKLDINHRSTISIINLLNQLRSDINQTPKEGADYGNIPTILIGSVHSASNWFIDNYLGEELYILTRNNSGVDEINNQIGASNNNLLREMYANDGNARRVKFIHSLLIALKYHLKSDYRNSIKEVIKPLKRSSRSKKVSSLSIRRLGIQILNKISNTAIREGSIFSYYSALKTQISNEFGFEIGSGLSRGNAKTFYENNSISSLLSYIKIDTTSTDLVRTIHSSKGTEFKNVMIHFDSINDFRNNLLNCNERIDIADDEARILYVAASRAKRNLFFNIPESNEQDIERITAMNLNHQILQ